MKAYLLAAVCLACGGSQPLYHSTSSEPTMTKAPSDDIEFRIAPAWHPGKNIELHQSLRPNKVEHKPLR